MEYRMKQLLPIVSWLTDKYTSKESSSVPYETAHRLMEAVIYCIDACAQNSLVQQDNSGNARGVYDSGYEKVIEKVIEAKAVYDQIIINFEDYRCRNYQDTIAKGMPSFFLKYDARFAPQDHLLTLDYPLINGSPDECGVNLIREYLWGIYLEKQFLDCIDKNTVIRLLDAIIPDYQNLYLDNICNPVLLTAVGCAAADRSVFDLKLREQDYQEITDFFIGDSVDRIAWKVKKLIRLLINQVIDDNAAAAYFEAAADSYAVRIWNGIQEQDLAAFIPTFIAD